MLFKGLDHILMLICSLGASMSMYRCKAAHTLTRHAEHRTGTCSVHAAPLCFAAARCIMYHFCDAHLQNSKDARYCEMRVYASAGCELDPNQVRRARSAAHHAAVRGPKLPARRGKCWHQGSDKIPAAKSPTSCARHAAAHSPNNLRPSSGVGILLRGYSFFFKCPYSKREIIDPNEWTVSFCRKIIRETKK
jgi:hypothetical protein